MVKTTTEMSKAFEINTKLSYIIHPCNPRTIQQNVRRHCEDDISDGRLFQVLATTSGNARSPIVESSRQTRRQFPSPRRVTIPDVNFGTVHYFTAKELSTLCAKK